MNILLDTCVVLDYLQGREPFFDDALELMISAARGECKVFITASSMTDIFYIIHRHTHSVIESRKYLSQLMYIIGLADTMAEDCINALHSDINDYEDAVMMETASRTQMDYIVTRNIRDYKKSQVPVVTPGELLLKIENHDR